MYIHLINYPHGVNSRGFVRVTWILLQALETILTYANSFGLKVQKCAYIENKLITRWTQLMEIFRVSVILITIQ